MRGQMGAKMVDELIKELALNEETATKVRALFDEYRQATRNWQQENGSKLRDLYRELGDARETKDDARVKDLTEQIKKLQQERLVPRDNLLKQLGDILTPEQIEKVKDVVIEWRAVLRMITRDMVLTDAQKTKLEEIIKTWREDTGEVTAERRPFANLRALFEKVVTEVILTDSQRQALAAMTGSETFFEKVMKLDLTDAQKAQIERFRGGPERGRRARSGPASGPTSGEAPPAGSPPPPPAGEGPQ